MRLPSYKVNAAEKVLDSVNSDISCSLLSYPAAKTFMRRGPLHNFYAETALLHIIENLGSYCKAKQDCQRVPKDEFYYGKHQYGRFCSYDVDGEPLHWYI